MATSNNKTTTSEIEKINNNKNKSNNNETNYPYSNLIHCVVQHKNQTFTIPIIHDDPEEKDPMIIFPETVRHMIFNYIRETKDMSNFYLASPSYRVELRKGIQCLNAESIQKILSFTKQKMAKDPPLIDHPAENEAKEEVKEEKKEEKKEEAPQDDKEKEKENEGAKKKLKKFVQAVETITFKPKDSKTLFMGLDAMKCAPSVAVRVILPQINPDRFMASPIPAKLRQQLMQSQEEKKGKVLVIKGKLRIASDPKDKNDPEACRRRLRSLLLARKLSIGGIRSGDDDGPEEVHTAEKAKEASGDGGKDGTKTGRASRQWTISYHPFTRAKEPASGTTCLIQKSEQSTQ